MASDRLDRAGRLLHEMTEWTQLNIGRLYESVSQFLAVSQAQSRASKVWSRPRREGDAIRRLVQRGEARE